MKKILCFIAIVMFISQGFAQLFYIQGGVNLANITETSDGRTEDNNTLTSFNAGFMGRFGLSPVIDLETGALLSGHGAKAETNFTGINGYVKSTFNPMYVQVPLNLIVKVPFENKTNMFFNAGPYLAVGVGGKAKVNSNIGIVASSSESKIKFSNDDPFTSEQDDAAYDKLKRFDYGINAGAGIDLGKILLKVNYGLGLAKINSTESNNNINDKNKYRTLSFSVGIPLSR